MGRIKQKKGIFASFKHFAAYVMAGALALTIFGVFISSTSVSNNQFTLFNRASEESSMSPINRWGNAGRFDGQTSYIEVLREVSNIPNMVNDFTIESYIRMETCPPYRGFIASVPGPQGGIPPYSYEGIIGIYSCNITYTFVTQNGSYSTVGSSTILDPGQWYHMAVTKDSRQLKLYINGQLEDTRVLLVNHPPVNQGDRLFIGKGGSNFTLPLDGQIDELRISSEARYSQNFTPPYLPFEPDPSTVILYHFDEQNGVSKIKDSSRNGYPGYVRGNVQFVTSTIPSPFDEDER